MSRKSLKYNISRNVKSGSMSLTEFERFSVYGFAIDYPINAIVELNPKSNHNEGDVAFKSSDGYKIFLSWGQIEKVEKFHGVDAHADYSLERIKGSREAKIRNIKRESAEVNGHDASFNHIELDLIKRGIFFNKTRTPQEVTSMHIHCINSSRYFVVYGPGKPDQAYQQGEVVARMIETFICHQESAHPPENLGIYKKAY